MEAKPPVDYSHYIENENAALPATAIHRHAQAGYNTTRSGEKVSTRKRWIIYCQNSSLRNFSTIFLYFDNEIMPK